MRARCPNLVEQMDRPDCDPERLRRTYAQFPRMNALVAGWRSIYRQHIRPLRPGTLLDIGCGGGDVALKMAEWAARDGYELQVTAADPDARAMAFLSSRAEHWPFEIEACQCTLRELLDAGRRFDVVISNHVLHHLEVAEFVAFRDECEAIAHRLVLHNDLERARLAGVGIQLMRPLFPGSFIIEDGATSIRRSYRRSELAEQLGPAWEVSRRWPCRLLARFEPEGSGS